VSLYLLPVLRGQSGSNIHETGFATSSNERIGNKLQKCDVSGILAFDSSNMSMQEYDDVLFLYFQGEGQNRK